MHAAYVALAIAGLVAAAKLGGWCARKLGQAAVVGEIVAGIAVAQIAGPAFAWVRNDAAIDFAANAGAVLLLFTIGIDVTVSDMRSVGRSAARVAVLGTGASLVAGTVASIATRHEAPLAAHLFVGGAIAATSVGISARVFDELGRARDLETRVVLGASVIDDVLGLVLLAVLSGALSATPGAAHLSAVAVVISIAKVIAFFAVTLWLGPRAMVPLFAAAARVRWRGAIVVTGAASCIFFAWCASALGLAPIVGAFVAGLVLEERHFAAFVARGERSLRPRLEPIASLAVPLFFVVMGARVDVAALAHGAAIGLAASLTLAAVVGKAACGLGAGNAHAVPVAIGMMPRGEVTLIYAALGETLVVGGGACVDKALYSALVAVVLVTTLLTPPALRAALASRSPAP